MPEQAAWTLDELVGRVSAALSSAAYPGSPNGRVRELPDRRAVRWYTTTGLVDRPIMQGRNAAYRTRHLLQIVAVKRLQAQGLSLAEIQAKLVGANDETLRRIADVPDELITAEQSLRPPAAAAGRSSRFWAEPPPAEPTTDSADTVTALAAVTLPGGAMLLLPARPDDGDIHAIRSAAAPLLELLADRGLLSLDDRSPL
ncbi:MerR family transcriptional regulator [Mycobacterium sp. Z3061]|uniref:MerR family transcriptional regulator n=1 Tax=Mycobacterium sp. Z3061 TaxID=3073562 RepID=UPI002873296E|nr:MerR family transcriptional regulator [Mycobacterium sp. Z3061]